MSGDLVVDGDAMVDAATSLIGQPSRIPLTAVPALEGSCSSTVIDEMAGLAMYYRISAQLTIDDAERIRQAVATAAESFTSADSDVAARSAAGAPEVR